MDSSFTMVLGLPREEKVEIFERAKGLNSYLETSIESQLGEDFELGKLEDKIILIEMDQNTNRVMVARKERLSYLFTIRIDEFLGCIGNRELKKRILRTFL